MSDPAAARASRAVRARCSTYDIMWREAMMELLDQLEAENPEDPALSPKDFAEWACVYIRYVQIFRKLEAAYDQIAHPQKLVDMKKSLEACMGRLLEVRHWLVKLNRGLDFLSIDDILVDLKLTPDELEIPIPKYFKFDRKREVDDRDMFLEKLIEKYQPRKLQATLALDSGPPLPMEEAVLLIQRSERGRQAREKMPIKQIDKRQRQLEDRRTRQGVALSHHEAVIKIQSSLRGMVWRKQIRKEANEELMFIGMKPYPVDPKTDPQVLEQKNLTRRKLQQAENMREYDRDIVLLKSKVRDTEGQDMRETIQDKINAWFVENRDPLTGEYPDFPEQEEGGSKVILNPPPPPPEIDAAAEEGKDAKKKPDAKKDSKKDAEAEVEVEEVITSIFVPDIEVSVQEFVAKWQDRDESTNFAQKYDPDLVKDELRPIVFEEIRTQVDEEMRILLENLKDMVDAEKAAKSGKKSKKKKKKKKKGKKKKDKKGKKKKDPTADRSMESLYVEMVSSGILQQCDKVHIQDYLGSSNFIGATMARAAIIPDPSMAQIRQAVTEFCILPLGSQRVHEKLEPHLKAVLLYGHPGTGKRMIAHAVAVATGANFFNISPRNIDGKYPKKTVQMMLHIVFKVAKTMAPSIIFIDEAEKVFLSDKKKLKEIGGSEPFNRMKKDLLKEMKQLKPGERVLVVGTSSEPYICAKKDEKALLTFFQKHICLPIPDYASRKLIWPGLIEKHRGRVEFDFDWPTLSQISQFYTSGQLDKVVRSLLTERRVDRFQIPSSAHSLQMTEIITWMAKLTPVSLESDELMRAFTDKTPARAALNGDAAGKKKAAASGSGKKGKKKKK